MVFLFLSALPTYAQHVHHEEVTVVTGEQKYALDEQGKPQQNFGVIPIHDNELFAFLYVNRLEQRLQESHDILFWDIHGWLGNDYHKLFLEREGQHEKSRNEILYGRPLSAFWNTLFGYRRDFIKAKADRNFAVIGIEGLAPFRFEVDAATYVSDEGDISATAEIEYILQLGQRLQFIPRFEVELALQDVEQYSVASGITSLEIGGRIGYQVIREIAPYLGVSWEKKLFETANMLAAEGKDTDHFAVVFGLRLIF